MEQILHKIKSLTKSGSLKNVLSLSFATVIANAISIFIAPINTRQYLSEDYGMSTLFFSLGSTLGIFATLQYNLAIILPESDEESVEVLYLNFFISVVLSALSLIVVILIGGWISEALKTPTLSNWLYFLPIFVLGNGANSALSSYANRKKEYKILSISRIFSSVCSAIISVMVGYLVDGALGLILSLLVFQTLGTIMLMVRLYKNYDILFNVPSYERVKAIAIKYKRFPIYTLPTMFINNFVNQVPIYMLTTFSGASATGFYGLGFRVLVTPIGLISSSVGEVFRQKAAEEVRLYGNCFNIFKKAFLGLAISSVGIFSVLIAFGPWIFSVLFGEKWTEAGVYAQIMGVMFMFKLTVSPLSYLFYLFEKNLEALITHIYMIVSTFLVMYVAYVVGGDAKSMLWAFSINYTTIYIYYLIRSYQFSKGKYQD